MKMLAALAFAPLNLVIQYFETFQKGSPPNLELLFDYFEDKYRGYLLRQQQQYALMLSIEM